MFFKTQKKKKKIETAHLIEAKFLSGIYGGQRGYLQTAIALEELTTPLMLSIGGGGTHQPPP
ncbi:MAG: hypothetical protein HRT35_07625 [Algicola sp.]|nr:hypothetical protein [Algicola sp.]